MFLAAEGDSTSSSPIGVPSGLELRAPSALRYFGQLFVRVFNFLRGSKFSKHAVPNKIAISFLLGLRSQSHDAPQPYQIQRNDCVKSI